MRVKQARWVVMALVALAGTLPACGGGGNDQGIVFRAVGIFRGLEQIEEGQITCTEPSEGNAIVDTAFQLDIDDVNQFPDRNNPNGDPCGGYIALENLLAFQSINVTRISIRYEVPGASIAVPGNPVSFGQRILPATSEAETTSGRANLLYAELVGQLVPNHIIDFLNQNVNRLPDTPYLMNAFLTAQGQSDDGTTYTTNEIGYQLTIATSP